MVTAEYTHVTVPVDDVDEAIAFYQDVFGFEEIPAVTFDTPVRWLDCGGLQLHLLEQEVPAPEFHHFALHVDDFETFYHAARANEGATFEALPNTEFRNGDPPIAYLPNGTVQAYMRDLFGNFIEINYPDVDDIDPEVVPNLVERPDVSPDTPEDGDIYGTYGLQPSD